MITYITLNKMNEKSFMELFAHRNVFTTKQVNAHLKGTYSKVYLDRLLKKGSIFRIGRGLYTCHEDPVVYASHITYPSYISFLWALNHHVATTQVPKVIEVVSRRNASYPNVRLIGSNYLWGYEKIDYGGSDIFVAKVEKAVIDSIIFERLPLDDINEALMVCNPDTLEEMAMGLNISDSKRVGYVCSLSGIDLKSLYGRISGDRNYVRSIYCSSSNDWMVKAC